MIKIIRWFLFPITIIYTIAVWIRNKFYDYGIFKSTSYSLPVISVGNLEIGGSGKTPLIEYLIRLLHKDYDMATLSRGYGRKTKGYRMVNEGDDASLSGDEPLQLKSKFKDISVAVCEDRVFGIDKLKKNHSLILLDDAYQHRAVKPGLSILLFDFHQLKKPKISLPTGNYREPFSGKKRADVIIITKCPNSLNKFEMEEISKDFKLSHTQNIFFTFIKYAPYLNNFWNISSMAIEEVRDAKIILLTGIAKSELLYEHIMQFSQQVNHHRYPDHHSFSLENMLKLVADFNKYKGKKVIVLTTEKDAIRLKSAHLKEIIKDLPIYIWPIEVEFLEGKTHFDQIIQSYAQSYQRIS